MNKIKSLTSMYRHYERLKKRLEGIGLVLQGTISPRNIIKQDSHKLGNKRVLGPYYQWTFKEKGKTLTVNLTASQAKTYQKAINNYRRMKSIIQEMRSISLTICEKTTVGVKKRKPTT